MDQIHASRWRKPRRKTNSKQGGHLQKARKSKGKKSEERREDLSPSAAPKQQSSTSKFAPIDLQNRDENFIIHASYLTNLVKNLQCSECSFTSLKVTITERQGFCVKLQIKCENCAHIVDESFTGSRMESQSKKAAPFKINRKMTEAFNNIGAGYSSLQKVCGYSSITPPCSRTFQTHLKCITSDLKKLEDEVLLESRKTVRDLYQAQDESLVGNKVIDIAGSYDGTWPTRGHKSLYGVGIMFDMLSGLVTDFQILSKYCQMCAIAAAELDSESPEFAFWHQGHVECGECNKNYEGASGSMEVRAAQMIGKRSVEYGIRYTTILSDGDARTCKQLNEDQPYGPDIEIKKEECINHIHKRLGTRLRDAAQKYSLGGNKEGALTGDKIKILQKYYRRAIVNNSPDLKAMKNAVKATLYHCCSTDQKPNHRLCPKGSSSWCFFNKTKALIAEQKRKRIKNVSVIKSHTLMKLRLNLDVLKKIESIYNDLSSEELLAKCIRGETQNRNESLHALIWQNCPKEVFVSVKRIHASVINAIIERNYGILKREEMKASMRNEEMSEVSKEVFDRIDTRRSKRKMTQDAARYSKRVKRCEEQRSTYEKRVQKSKDYGAGCH